MHSAKQWMSHMELNKVDAFKRRKSWTIGEILAKLDNVERATGELLKKFIERERERKREIATGVANSWTYIMYEYACYYNKRFEVIRSITLDNNVPMICTQKHTRIELWYYGHQMGIEPLKCCITIIFNRFPCKISIKFPWKMNVSNTSCKISIAICNICNKVLSINSMLNVRCSSKPYRKCYFTLQSVFLSLPSRICQSWDKYPRPMAIGWWFGLMLKGKTVRKSCWSGKR